MSITLGVYELFAYTIPGILYIYVANEFLRLFGLTHIEYDEINDLFSTIMVMTIAYVSAQVLVSPARKWRRWRQVAQGPAMAIQKLKTNHPYAEINFLPQDWYFLLYGLIRRFHPGSAETIERVSAISMMLQQISFGLLLYVLFQITSFFMSVYSLKHLPLAVLALIAALSVKRRSQMYNQWFYDSIYDISLSFGSTAEKIIRKTQARKSTGDD
jgi:hypothetical protein